VRAVAAGDEPALRAFSGQPAKVARLMASGDLGLIALSEGRIQAMEWIRPGPAEYDWDARRLGLVFHVPPRYCWLHNGSGGGVGPWAMVMGRLPLILEARGIDVACLQVASENVYSIQCHESLGFRRSGTAAALRLGQRPLVWLRTNGRMSLQFREMALDLHRLAPR
jgi:hypothetical protein